VRINDPRHIAPIPAPRLPTYAPGTELRVTSPPIIPPPYRREPGRVTTAWQPRAVVLPPPVPTESTLPHEAEDAPDASGLPHEADGDV
jgi:hypothetical protein